MPTVEMNVQGRTPTVEMHVEQKDDVLMCASSEVRIVRLSDYVSKEELRNSNVLSWGEPFPAEETN